MRAIPILAGLLLALQTASGAAETPEERNDLTLRCEGEMRERGPHVFYLGVYRDFKMAAWSRPIPVGDDAAAGAPIAVWPATVLYPRDAGFQVRAEDETQGSGYAYYLDIATFSQGGDFTLKGRRCGSAYYDAAACDAGPPHEARDMTGVCAPAEPPAALDRR